MALDLDARHGVPGSIVFRDSPLGGTVAELSVAGGTAVIALRGGQVLSYIPRGGVDALWLSPLARLDGAKAVRGGIPVCWPWFGPHPADPALPAHGFVRVVDWQVAWAAADAETARLRLEWPLPMTDVAESTAGAPWRQLGLTLDVTLGSTLDLALTTHNRGDTAVELSQALHTYLRTGDVEAIRIDGLDGRDYIDKVAPLLLGAAPTDPVRCRQAGSVAISQEVDRVYVDTVDSVCVTDKSLGRRITVAKRGSASTVVWNPWTEKAARLGDLGPDGHRPFVCIEAANAGPDSRVIGPDATHLLGTTIAVSPL